MLPLAHILAQRDDDGDWIKFVLGALIFAFWLISALASAISKKQQKERRGRVREKPDAPPHPASPPLSRQRDARQTQTPIQPARRSPPPPRQPARAAQRSKPAVQRRAQSRSTGTFVLQAPTPPADQPAPHPRDLSHPPEAAPPTASRRAPITATASALARWLNPKTLRQQYILTEILRQPVALRDDADR